MALLKIVSGQNPREIAARVLGRRDHGYIEDLLEQALAQSPLSALDRGLCQELVYGVVRWQRTLDWLIERKTPNRTQKVGLQNLLRLGLYQIFWLDRIPPHAAVHETVELARQGGFGPQSGFVNAVLRGYLREIEPARQLLQELKTKEPAVGYSHPAWLVDRWQARYGTAETSRLLAWNNAPPKTYARVNTLKTDAGKLLEQWRMENVEYDFVRGDWFEENLVFELKSHPPLTRIPSFQQGLFYIQDPSTLLAVRELEPKPGETILDLCAAPGGKLTYIGQIMRNEGTLIPQDTSSDRMRMVRENCTRMGLTCVHLPPDEQMPNRPIEPLTSPTSQRPRLDHARFDKILLDAPCSNTGVMRRRVDLRWRIQPQEIRRLCRVQSDLLLSACKQVKRGGILVYSTCSLEPEENGEVIQEFLSTHVQFTLERERTLTPFVEGLDGAYTARLRVGA
jgi:16S rRNA (cytosine967-C5)-methyltransferase